MRKNLRTKAILILLVIVGCLYGIFGVPKSKDEAIANLRKNVKLGLDLRGGSHLVLQVQVQDAIKSEADQAIERLREDLRRENITYQSMERNDPTTIEAADSI